MSLFTPKLGPPCDCQWFDTVIDDINNSLDNRWQADASLEVPLSIRPTNTRYVYANQQVNPGCSTFDGTFHSTFSDDKRIIGTKQPQPQQPIVLSGQEPYDPQIVFAPITRPGPYTYYSNNINTETELQGRTRTLFSGDIDQPNSWRYKTNSDMYDSTNKGRTVVPDDEFPNLHTQQQFVTRIRR